MTPEQRQQLLDEVQRGDKALKAYDFFIKDFIERKKSVLFDKFKTIGIEQTDNILEIKRMAITLDSMDVEITSLIDTGKMAAKTLADDNES